ncbi:MAG: hypothetical protein GY851_19310, partial [bacterium]|nr:hypothetical protein [bacterium]
MGIRIRAIVLVAAVLAGAVCGAAARLSQPVPVGNAVQIAKPILVRVELVRSLPPVADPLPITPYDEDVLELTYGLGQAARANGGWWQCGELLPREVWFERAVPLAHEIVAQA